MKSDRISAITQELRKMGGKVLEQPDGLIVQGPAKLRGCEVDGHNDYMVVAALAVAGMFAEGKTVVKGADALGTSSTRFVAGLREIGAELSYS
jgi:3-phosphoshikimate 1-carboxyvinyltransferase